MKMTLLQQFIADKMGAYKEPTRKGTPRGEPIGLTKKKYCTVLLCLMGVPLKEIAKSVKVSYGLLRKWRTEDAFKSELDHIEDEFVGLFYEHIWERARKGLNLFRDHILLKSYDDVLNTPPPELNFTEYNDLQRYSPDLLAKILQLLSGIDQKIEQENILARFPESRGHDQDRDFRDAVVMIFRKQMIGVLEILESVTHPGDKGGEKQVEHGTGTLKRQIEDIQRDYMCKIVRLALEDGSNEMIRKLAICHTYYFQQDLISVDFD